MTRPRVNGPVVLDATGEHAGLTAKPWPAAIIVAVLEIPFSSTPTTWPGPSSNDIPLTPSAARAR